MSLQGRVALITGSTGGGFGRSISLSLAREGADIVLNYGTHSTDRQPGLKVARAIREMGSHALLVKADTAKAADAKRMVVAAQKRFGRLDILVNNAGGPWKPQPLDDVEPDHWQNVMDAEVNGAFYCIKYALPLMRKRKWGRIINIGWWEAAPWRKPPMDYSIGKAARHLIAEKLATTEIKNGITINNIAPGAIPHIELDEAASAARDPAKRPKRQNASPGDIAEIAVWLCSDAARFASGGTIWVLGREATM